MERKALAHLKEWYKNQEKRPLLLRGARQVGKSTLVRLFCKQQKIELFELNLEKVKLKSCGRNSIDIEAVLKEIEDILQKQFSSKPFLIFFDEIQAQAELFKYLRYFYEERPEISIIAAGSLLEFYLSEELFSVPVGRLSYYFLGPMDFEEYLFAQNQKVLLKRLQNFEKITTEQHNTLLKYQKEYFYTGGMPAAIKAFIKSKSYLVVRQIQFDILQTYRDDFLKYAKSGQINNLGKVFDFVPFNLGQKIKYSEIDSTVRAEQMRTAINLLIKARVLLPVYHANGASLPLSTFEDPSVYKLYFLDIGLVHAAQKVTWDQLDQIFGDLNQRGAVYEQFIVQHLMFRYSGFEEPHLNYWLKDKIPGKAEIDFLFQDGVHIYPIEVKAGATGSLKSLWQFIKEKKAKYAIQFCGNQFQVSQEKYNEPAVNQVYEVKLYKVPHYLVSKIIKIIHAK